MLCFVDTGAAASVVNRMKRKGLQTTFLHEDEGSKGKRQGGKETAGGKLARVEENLRDTEGKTAVKGIGQLWHMRKTERMKCRLKRMLGIGNKEVLKPHGMVQ